MLRKSTCLSFILLACLALLPAVALAEPEVEILSAYAFDPTIGKQLAVDNFEWPAHRRLSALVRYETRGYDRRKTVTVFFAIRDREDNLLHKYESDFLAHAGQHELVLPHKVDLSENFGQHRMKLEVQVKLAGSNRAELAREVLIHGPDAPRVTVADQLLLDPDSGEALDAIGPGQRFLLTGTVEVEGNSSGHLPDMFVWGLMDSDQLQDEPWGEEPFSDLYWDWLQLDATNGKWSYAVEGVMPQKYIDNPVTSQPYTFHTTVMLVGQPYYEAILSGTVTASGSGLNVGENLDERLIWLERNWEWELEEIR